LKRFVPAGRLKAMTLFACVPMPYSMALPALRRDWPPALELTRTSPKAGLRGLPFDLGEFLLTAIGEDETRLGPVGPIAPKPLPPSVTTRKSSFAPSSETSISTLWFGVFSSMTLDWKSGFGAARTSAGARKGEQDGFHARAESTQV
jgi:hypothetical protein